MKELITRPQADTLIAGIAALGVIVALAVALIARRHGLNPAKYATLTGGPLLVCAALWPIYNAIEDHFGLDSVAALALNLGLFLIIGSGLGFGWAKVFAKSTDSAPSEGAVL